MLLVVVIVGGSEVAILVIIEEVGHLTLVFNGVRVFVVCCSEKALRVRMNEGETGQTRAEWAVAEGRRSQA